ncbi:MAG: hypothetical protein QOC59_781 [Microbacteriaceae bacterium]|nr:hypothetical protein [Microbacteriaceae bacterium]
MENTNTRGDRRHLRARTAALVAGGLLAGGAAAGIIGVTAANAATTAPSPTASYSVAGPGGPAVGRSDEQVVTGTKAATLKAAALNAVPGGTVIRVETDAGDGAYEAHMTKADGSAVTVKFDDALKVTAVEDGMGKGDPARQSSTAG